MSISDPSDIPLGAPDPSLIAQMANGFFRTAPSQIPPAGPGAALPSSQVPTNAPIAPTVSAQAYAPASIAQPSAPSTGAGGAMPASPVPAGEFGPAGGFGPTLSPSDYGHGAAPQPSAPGAAGPSFSGAPPAPNLASIPYALGDETQLLRPVDTQFVRQVETPAAPQAMRADPFAVRSDALLFRPEIVAATGLTFGPFDPRSVKRDFPILQEKVNGRDLVWLDNAATTQKPQAVIERLSHFYRHENSNIHRGAHELAARATDAYEAARDKIARFLGAGSPREIVFVRGATEAINLVAQAWGRRHVSQGDEIVITWLEHHANIVPWQQLCAETGAVLRVAPVDDSGQIILEEYEKLLGPRTKLVSLTQVSNALGTVTPAREMTAMAHRHGARVLVDGAQAVSHMPAQVQTLDCDFYVLSGHKMFGPTGIGVLYGKPDALAEMPPWQGGGNMIADVTFERTIYQAPPDRFEAGTGNIADAVGLGAAVDYLEKIGMPVIQRYEHELLVYATAGLQTVPGLRLIGTAAEKTSVLSFVLDGKKTEDIGKALNQEGIAVRSGHHCAQPILRRFGLESTVRPSLAFYNSCEDIDRLVAALRRIQAAG